MPPSPPPPATPAEPAPRFSQAAAQARRLKAGAWVLAAITACLLLIAGGVRLFAPGSAWVPLLGNLAACLVLLAAALQAAYWPARWRVRAMARPGPATPVDDDSAQVGWYDRTVDRLLGWCAQRLQWLGPPSLWLVGWSTLALALVFGTWNLAPVPAAANLATAAQVALALMVLAAFGLLVVERHLAHARPAEWPEASRLVPFCRLVIACVLVAAFCGWLNGGDRAWPGRLASLMGVLPAAVAGELLVRAVAALFQPLKPEAEPRLLGTSALAALLQWPPRPLQALHAQLQGRFGIDLRQNWAFGYIRRAAPPLALVMLGLGWLLSGLYQVPLTGRGIYEQFGRPMQVLGPGLHVGLPWPLGRLLPVENGTVHEVATALDGPAPDLSGTADGPAPPGADRLWDATHARDNTQVIASGVGNRQSFQVVNMDVRFVYRIGLTDADALAASYQVADIPALIRATASRVLVHTLASQTLDGLLGNERRGLAERLGSAVQADLRQANSGVDILATVIEAIHPPAGAANAYHGVQAAQIGVQALVARERGAAAERQSTARLNAFDNQVQAQASAREQVAKAEAAAHDFEADRQAYAGAGHAFLFERYLAQLGEGLGQAQLLLLDHRLGATEAPTLDLRTFSAPVDATARPSSTRAVH